MKEMEERIRKEGKVFPGSILKVDSFLNHQIDPSVMQMMAEAFYQRFQNAGITKVLTVEASGIAIAVMTAARFQVPMVFAKKSKSKNISDDVYSAPVVSYTHGTTHEILLSKEYLTQEDCVLIVDDFLAIGNASKGLMQIVEKAGAKLAGIGVAIEKGFQGGGDELRARGIPVESLAIVERLSDDGEIIFR